MGYITALLYPVLGAVLYYIGARAVITQPLWSRASDKLYAWLACPACSGTWYCLTLAIVGAIEGWPFLGLPGENPGTWILAALWGCFWVPFFAAAHMWVMTHALSDDDSA